MWRPVSAAALGAGAILLSSCVPQGEGPSVFGGVGAQVGQQEMALPKDEGPKHYGACSGPAPASDVSLLDDFEDGDNKPFRAFEREAWWFTVTDKTAGSTIWPEGEFKAEALPPASAAPENRFAAHIKAQGQTSWGMMLSTSLRWSQKGIKCPFNASLFSGLKFRAKGPGKIEVAFPLPETVKAEAGGICTEGCYDTHRQAFFLTDQWQEYKVRWDRVQQGGWGAEVRFDPARLIGVNFLVGVKDLPADFWIDDIELTPRAPGETR